MFRYCSTSNACSYHLYFFLEAEAPYVQVLFYHCLKQCLFLPSDLSPWGWGPLCSGTALPLPEAMLILTFKPFSLSLRPLMFRYCSTTGWSNACSYLQTVLLEAEAQMFRYCSTTSWSNACSYLQTVLLEAKAQMFRYCSTTSWSNACSYLQTFLLKAEAPYVQVLFCHCLKQCLFLPSDPSHWGWGPLCSGTVLPLPEAMAVLTFRPSSLRLRPLCSVTVLPLPEAMLVLTLRPSSLRLRPPMFRYCSTTAWSNVFSYLQTILLEAEAPYVQVLFYHCLKQCLFIPSDPSPWGWGPLSSGTVLPLAEAMLVFTFRPSSLRPGPPMYRYCLNQYLLVLNIRPSSLRLRPQMFMYCSITAWSNACSYLQTLLFEAEAP